MGVETSESRVKAAVPDARIDRGFGKIVRILGNGDGTILSSSETHDGTFLFVDAAWDAALLHPIVVAFESSHRVQDAPEVLREAEGKPHVHVFDSDVLPMQFGENLSPDVERYNSLFCACGHVAHFGTWLAARPLSPASFDGKFHAFMLIGKMLDVLLPKGHQLTKEQSDAVHACAEKLATDLISGEYALSSTRPEGEAKIAWRVDVHKTLGPAVQCLTSSSEAEADDDMDDAEKWTFTASVDKVRIVTTETVIETRTKEPSRG